MNALTSDFNGSGTRLTHGARLRIMKVSPCGNIAESALKNAVANGSCRTQCRSRDTRGFARKRREEMSGFMVRAAGWAANIVWSILRKYAGRLKLSLMPVVNMPEGIASLLLDISGPKERPNGLNAIGQAKQLA
jgi:hypothetical protein